MKCVHDERGLCSDCHTLVAEARRGQSCALCNAPRLEINAIEARAIASEATSSTDLGHLAEQIRYWARLGFQQFHSSYLDERALKALKAAGFKVQYGDYPGSAKVVSWRDGDLVVAPC